MLKIILPLTVMLACAMAMSDPRAGWCMGKCDAWEKLEQDCIEDHNCYPNGQWDDNFTPGCVEQCWEIPAPCRRECFDTFEDCSHRCAGNYENCFEACFFDNFNPPILEPSK